MKIINISITIFLILTAFFIGRNSGIKHNLDEFDQKYTYIMTVNNNKTNTFTWRNECDAYLDIPANFRLDAEKQKFGKFKVVCKDIPSKK